MEKRQSKAERWAKSVTGRRRTGKPTINIYEFENKDVDLVMRTLSGL